MNGVTHQVDDPGGIRRTNVSAHSITGFHADGDVCVPDSVRLNDLVRDAVYSSCGFFSLQLPAFMLTTRDDERIVCTLRLTVCCRRQETRCQLIG